MRKILFIFICLVTSIGKTQTYEVKEVDLVAEPKELAEVNSEYSDFSPFVLNNQFYFISMREYDMYNIGENNWKKTGFLNVFVSDLKGDISPQTEIKKTTLYDNELVSNSHTGPICFSITGDTLFFSQVVVTSESKRKGSVSKPQIFMRVLENGKWKVPKILNFCDHKSSYSHPSFDSKNQLLYFTSDKEGGKGLSDIYTSKIDDGVWGIPENLQEINSEKNEAFPFICDDILFFASDNSQSIGGLDVFWKALGGVEDIRSLKGINSEQDDFGVYIFDDMKKGYFSSNRNLKTKDDLFFLYLEKQVTIKNEISGNFTFRNLSIKASDLLVKITDSDGFELTTSTDENGDFIVQDLKSEGPYKFQPLTEEEMELVFYDKDGNITSELISGENEDFVYKLLKKQNSGTLSLIPDNMSDFNLDQGHLSGQFIFEDKPGEYPDGLPVYLTNDKGDIVFTTTADKRGNFDFRELSLKSNYFLQTKESQDNLVLLIFDKKGNVSSQLKSNKQSNFIYRKLDISNNNSLVIRNGGDNDFELSSKTISGLFEYKNSKNLLEKKLKIQTFSEEGSLLLETFTNEKGEFRFRSLPIGDNILFKVVQEDDNFVMDDFNLFIYDRDGKKIAVLHQSQNGFFIYKPLGFKSDTELSFKDANGDDFALNIATSYAITTVYFNSNESAAITTEIPKLNDIVKILKKNPKLKVDVNAYADAKASDEYNLLLSEKRGNWIVSYMKKKGISTSRFAVNAYGEAQLVDQNIDELNRRAEIRVYE